MAQIEAKHAACFLLAGAAVGAAVALLYAPQSGARTKRDIRKFARKSAGRLDDLQSNIRDQVTDWVSNATEIVEDGIGRGKTIGTESYEKVLLSFDSAKKCVEDGKNRLAQLIQTT